MGFNFGAGFWSRISALLDACFFSNNVKVQESPSQLVRHLGKTTVYRVYRECGDPGSKYYAVGLPTPKVSV